jgi:hypothetical protein
MMSFSRKRRGPAVRNHNLLILSALILCMAGPRPFSSPAWHTDLWKPARWPEANQEGVGDDNAMASKAS